MNILIVEPHFDDGWINLGGFILSHPGDNFFILTLSNYVTNYKNGTGILKNYLSNIDGHFLNYKSLGFDDHHMGQLIRKYRENNFLKLFLKINHFVSLKKIRNEIKKFGKNKDKIFWPLGMKHPQHLIMDNLNPFNSVSFYREYPYFFYIDQQRIIKEKTEGYKKRILNISKFAMKKKKMFELAYSDQLFFYDLKINNKKLGDLKTEIYWEKSVK